MKCRYDDCPNAVSGASTVIPDESEEDTQVTCPICREDLGLPIYPPCSEGDHLNDDNPGQPMCKTCADWHVAPV